jgi:hypothetical protein
MGGLFEGDIENSLESLRREDSKRHKEGFTETGPDVEWNTGYSINANKIDLMHDTAIVTRINQGEPDVTQAASLLPD